MSTHMVAHLAVSPETIRDFCHRHQICRLSSYGSVLRDDFRPDSDIDVLVQFKPDIRYCLSDLVQMGDAGKLCF